MSIRISRAETYSGNRGHLSPETYVAPEYLQDLRTRVHLVQAMAGYRNLELTAEVGSM